MGNDEQEQAIKVEPERFFYGWPRFIDIKGGKVLAVSTEDSNLRIGVEGIDVDDAREKFRQALDAWNDLHERAELKRTRRSPTLGGR